MDSISEIIDAPQVQNVALAGLSHLGHAVLNYFHGRRTNLQIIARLIPILARSIG